jgi:hypothetical protein
MHTTHTREDTAKALALYSRLQTKIPEDAVAARRGGMRSSEGAKAVVEAKQRAAMLEVQVEQRRRVDRTEKKAKGSERLSSCLEGRGRRRHRRILGAFLGKCAKGAEALRDQIRLRGHVCKIKNMGVNTGPDNAEVAIARLMAALPSLVAVPLPKGPPPPPLPYPKRAAHPDPTRAAVVFELKHLAAISAFGPQRGRASSSRSSSATVGR